jgi:hypothetical protein
MRLPRWFARPGRECTISRLMPLVNATVVTETRTLRIPAGVEATHLASSAMRGCEGKVALVAEGTAPEHRPWWFVKFPRYEISPAIISLAPGRFPFSILERRVRGRQVPLSTSGTARYTPLTPGRFGAQVLALVVGVDGFPVAEGIRQGSLTFFSSACTIWPSPRRCIRWRDHSVGRAFFSMLS